MPHYRVPFKFILDGEVLVEAGKGHVAVEITREAIDHSVVPGLHEVLGKICGEIRSHDARVLACSVIERPTSVVALPAKVEPPTPA